MDMVPMNNLLGDLDLNTISQTVRPELDADYQALVFSGSSLTLFQTCKTKFFFGKVLRLFPNAWEPVHMDRGTLVHWMLAEYYRAILKNPRVERITLLQRINSRARVISTDLEFDSEVLERVLSSFTQYVLYYTNDWEPVGIEQPFLSLLGTVEEYKLKIYFEGKMDLIVRIPDGTYSIIDHKSIEANKDKDGKKGIYTARTNQTKGYSLASGIPNVVINQFGLQTSLPPAEKFKRLVISHTPEMLEEWRTETIRDGIEMYLRYKDVSNLSIEDHNTIMIPFPKNNGHCGFCEFKFICSAPPTMRPWNTKAHYTQRTEAFDVFESTELTT